jgi:hypothetical protein
VARAASFVRGYVPPAHLLVSSTIEFDCGRSKI